MPYKIKIFNLSNGYFSFSVNNFSSFHHYSLCPNIKSMYKYANDAYKDAKNLSNKYKYHIDHINKYAIDKYYDLNVQDISSEDMLVGHYQELLDEYQGKAKDIPDFESDEKTIIYGEIKSIVSELLKVRENLEEEKDKNKINKIINGFSSIAKKHFMDLLLKDKKELDKSEKPKEESIQEGDTGQVEVPIAEDNNLLSDVSSLEAEKPKLNALNSDTNYIIKLSKKIKISKEEIKELLEEYCDRISHILKENNKSIICSPKSFKIVISNSDGEILEIKVNKNLLINSIIPLGKLSKTHPYNSLQFYQLYWKPIIEALGHYYLYDSDKEYIINTTSLPNVPSEFPFKIGFSTLDLSNGSKIESFINFSDDKYNSWNLEIGKELIKEASNASNEKYVSKYTEQDYFKDGKAALVKCIDTNLKSIFNSIGEVQQVIPLEDHIELDINFGNHIVRLTEQQIEMMPY